MSRCTKCNRLEVFALDARASLKRVQLVGDELVLAAFKAKFKGWRPKQKTKQVARAGYPVVVPGISRLPCIFDQSPDEAVRHLEVRCFCLLPFVLLLFPVRCSVRISFSSQHARLEISDPGDR